MITGSDSTAKTSENSSFENKVEQIIEALGEECILDKENHLIYASELAKVFEVMEQANIPLQGNEKFYLAVIETACYADQLALGFETLAKAGVAFEENKTLYAIVIEKSYFADKLSQILNALIKAEIGFEENKDLYSTVIETANYQQLVQGFEALSKAGITLKENKDFYSAAIKHPSFVYNLSKGLKSLNKSGISFEENKAHYLALIKNPFYADKLPQGLEALEKAGIPFEENKPLYLKIIENTFFAEELSQGLETLTNSGVLFKENKALYLKLTESLEHLDTLSQGFAGLAKAGIAFEENETLYLKLIENGYHADKLSLLFVTLAKVGIAFEQNKDLYSKLAENSYNADKLSQGVEALAKADIVLQNNEAFCLALMENSDYADKLPQGLEALAKAGIALQNNEALYLAVIKNVFYASNLPKTFEVLREIGVAFQDNEVLYSAVIDNAQYADKLPHIFKALTKSSIPFLNNKTLILKVIKNMASTDELLSVLEFFNKIGLRFEQHPKYFNTHMLFTHTQLANTVFKELIQTGYSLKAHKAFFNTLVKLLSREDVHYQTIINIVNNACAYAKANPKKIQAKALTEIIHCATIQYDFLTFGPLNKSGSTTEIEALLEKICAPDLDLNNALTFREPSDYILSLPIHAEINLSLLIKNANLSQLMLNDDLIETLGEKLESIMTVPREDRSTNPIVNLLPKAQQLAMRLYIGPEHYKNINRLFRAEALEADKKICLDNESNNKLAYFIIGCLLNDAANKIAGVIDQQPEKKLLDRVAHHYDIEMSQYLEDNYNLSSLLEKSLQEKLLNQADIDALKKSTEKLRRFYPPKNMRLDRGEFITLDVMKRRAANAWAFPSLTSFSASKEGSPFFHNPATVRTVLENAPHRYIINDSEAEVIFPQGTQVVTSRQVDSETQEVKLVSTIYRSPSLELGNHYWSDMALNQAFEKYLNKPYALLDDSIVLKGVMIARPNHGLAHTYRVMLATEYVAHYFAHHAKDPEFKLFCQSLTADDLEWLRVAGAFSISGRENEMSAGQDLALYDTFRQASCEHFMAFVNETAVDAPEDMKQRMQNIVRYMGNPRYESEINLHDNEIERKIRNYYHRILSIAHKLDLPRCYAAGEYAQSLQLCRDLSAESATQKQALDQIMRHLIALNKAHGNRLSCDIQPNGDLVGVNIPYQDIFGEVSQSWKRLFEITDMVTRPKKTLPFQFESSPVVLFSKSKPKKHKAPARPEVKHDSVAMRTRSRTRGKTG